VEVKDGILNASGTAPQSWIDTARKQAKFVGGINKYDDSHLVSEEAVKLSAAAQSLNSASLDFLSGTTELAAGESQKLPRIVEDVRVALTCATQADKKIQITIVGHADKPGDEHWNEELSQLRADAILLRLQSSGLDSNHFIARGVGTRMEPGDTLSRTELGPRRAVSFHVELQDN
jgi:outer membrane protein OmpA-like peptidoglycan-associated protein